MRLSGNGTKLALFAILAIALPLAARAADPDWIATGTQGMVASDSQFASNIGRDVLIAGGNAIDASVAVSFALAVARPYSTGLGGGGFLIARLADGRVVVLDFRETAPAAATSDMYLRAARDDPNGPPPSEFGHLAVAVPGVVAGQCQILAQLGTMSLARVLAPAIRLARKGFPVDAHHVKSTRSVLNSYAKYPSLKRTCRYVYETYLGGGQAPTVGETLTQPKLARLLEELALNGPEFFYRGPVAQAIASEMKRYRGIITAKDLADYQVRRREPIRATYREYELISMPPPSSGGVALAQILNILEQFDLSAIAEKDPSQAIHYQIEALKHAFADRARWLGDSDFASVPVAMLTSKAYTQRIARMIDPQKCLDLDAYGSANIPNDSGTSHHCVVDRWGNVVVTTETINTSFGSLVAVKEWGLILNNEMDDFVSRPGQPNTYGLVQSARNSIEPGKRPLSSMTPTIVLKDRKPFLMLGASGGPRIISSVLNVLLGVTDLGMSLKEAMLHPRPHHQWKPDQVFFDTGPAAAVKRGLVERGHKLADKRKTGVVQAIQRSNGGWTGASDPRKGGRPAGVP